MRDKVTRITEEIGKVLDLQSELFHEESFQNLSSTEVDEYHKRRDRIRQLCSDLTGLNSYNEV
jgi:hypothetical protein